MMHRLASIAALLLLVALAESAIAQTTTVDFDNPAPPGASSSLVNGVFQGIDFGTGQWRWETAYNVDATNHVFFDSPSGTSRSFRFSPGPRLLTSLRVFTSGAGTLTLADDQGQTLTRPVPTGSMQLVTTGWTRASTVITVTFTSGWNLGIDDITSSTAPSGQEDTGRPRDDGGHARRRHLVTVPPGAARRGQDDHARHQQGAHRGAHVAVETTRGSSGGRLSQRRLSKLWFPTGPRLIVEGGPG